MDTKNLRLCFIGNMLGRNPSFIATQGQVLADHFSADGYRVQTASSRINRVSRLAEIVSVIVKGWRNTDVVLVEVYSGLNFLVACVVGAICAVLKLPVIMMLHGGELPIYVRKHPRLARGTLSRATALVAPSRFIARELSGYGFNVRVIPNIIDIEQYPFRRREKVRPRLLWMRSFHPIYNPEMAVEVLARLRGSYPHATLTLAGKDKGLEESLRSLVSSLGLSKAVRFAGFLDMKGKIAEMSRADVYINTNRVDNMPVAVIEARAMGLPVVATDVGGLPYLVEHNRTGLLVENGDVDGMVRQVARLLEDPKLASMISANGRAAAERSAWASVRVEWESLIADVANSSRLHLRQRAASS